MFERGLAKSRAEAQQLILAGKVLHGTIRMDKPGQQIAVDLELTVEQPEHPWVSRGGQKLAHAIEEFHIDVKGWIAADIGASTGGFTDVLLQNDAAKVYAVDVGQGQLAWNLRSDARVVVMEKTNARYLTDAEISDPLDMVVCDASFISLRTVLPAALDLARPGATLVALIKPQFEVGKGKVGKGGVVKDEALHKEVCDTILHWLEQEKCWKVNGLTESPLLGPKGNKEFLVWAEKGAV